jgi:hypothetical protein
MTTKGVHWTVSLHTLHVSGHMLQKLAHLSLAGALPKTADSSAPMQGKEIQAWGSESNVKPAFLRSLQEADGTAVAREVRYVSTAQGLRAALDGAVRHIVITEHLDLTSLQPFSRNFPRTKLQLLPATWSIRVRLFTCSRFAASIDHHTDHLEQACCARTPELPIPCMHSSRLI